MFTRSKAKAAMELDPPLYGYQESKYNIYDGQQVCTVRDCDLREYHDEAQRDGVDMNKVYQIIYDAGAAMMNLQIVKKINNRFELNQEFGDYMGWEHARKVVIKNCEFLHELGHKQY